MIVLNSELSDYQSVLQTLVPKNSISDLRPGQIDRLHDSFSRLEASLWADLSLPAFTPRESAEHRNLIDLYSDSRASLDRWRDEANAFLHAICVSNVVSYGEPSNRISPQLPLEKEVNRIYEPIEIRPLPAPEQLDAAMAGTEVAILHNSFEQALAITLHEFLQRFAISLGQLFRGASLGSIAWTSPTMCKFEFSLREVRIGSSQSIGGQTLDGGSTRRTVRHIRTGYDVLDWEIEHHLDHAQSNSRIGLPQTVPQRVEHLWDSIPPWLQPYAGVTTGRLFRKCAAIVDNWEDTIVRREIVDQPLDRFDPAVTLFGQIVLTAWDDLELTDSRRTEILRTGNAPKSDIYRRDPILGRGRLEDEDMSVQALVLAGSLFFVPVIASLISSVRDSATFFLPIIFAALCFANWLCVIPGYAVHHNGSGGSNRFSQLAVFSGGMWACASVVVMPSVIYGSLPGFLISVFTICCGAYAWWKAKRELSPPTQ